MINLTKGINPTDIFAQKSVKKKYRPMLKTKPYMNTAYVKMHWPYLAASYTDGSITENGPPNLKVN